jgi:hypothetical protein
MCCNKHPVGNNLCKPLSLNGTASATELRECLRYLLSFHRGQSLTQQHFRLQVHNIYIHSAITVLNDILKLAGYFYFT